jgi:hydrogenase maturation protein HypF
MRQRAKATVTGIVQGVGFRPFIYNLAQSRGLGGYIANTSTGVDIEVVGESGEIEGFFQDLRDRPPPLAKIAHIELHYLSPRSYQGFEIRKSKAKSVRTAFISPDVSICEDCLREMNDPQDRRYRYPFINCTNCGPRYTIIQDIPYDRYKTTMSSFAMCKACRKEYEDPMDRRFHAQPVACWDCGPRVMLGDRSGQRVESSDPIGEAIGLLKRGKTLAIKGLGGFHLAVNATDGSAVERLRERKCREEKPLALMSMTLEQISRYAHMTTLETDLLQALERPIVLLRKKKPNSIAPGVAPRNDYLGVMLPYTPIHYLLLQGDFDALVMTSGNISEEPIAIENEEALRRLSDIADFFLLHNRDIYLRNDDSVSRVLGRNVRIVRRSRGYAPSPVFLDRAVRPTLSCGPFLANTVCLAKEKQAFLSQHVGDLDNLETLEAFEKTIDHMKTIFEIDPEVIAYDLHPDYLSTRYAANLEKGTKIGVQHHHAHIVSCMAEHGMAGPVIGVAMDGTGYGEDGTIWGGEILVADCQGFDRVGHFQPVALPGGEAAIREPWRMALVYLYQSFGESLFDLPIEFVERLESNRARTILAMIQKDLNTPKTSSCGRLFDGVASLLGLREKVSYRGQAAVELEMAIREGKGAYRSPIQMEDDRFVIFQAPIVRGVVSDLKDGMDRGEISWRFHNTLAQVFTQVCVKVRDRRKLNRVVLSGGVFQNAFLLDGLEKKLTESGFEVYTHSLVPTNDGGIALGQTVVANAILDAQG